MKLLLLFSELIINLPDYFLWGRHSLEIRGQLISTIVDAAENFGCDRDIVISQPTTFE